MGLLIVKKRRICVVTTSRADFGLLHGLINEIAHDPRLSLQCIASGTHAARGFGRTGREIEKAGLSLDLKIPMRMTGNSALSGVSAIAHSLTLFGKAFAHLKPDIVVLLGDRFELFAPAVPALMLQIPIAHIHGGEVTEGAIDDSVRHAITKMASLHFTATETSRRRILQMGEDPGRVFNCGAPGLDAIHNANLLTREELEEALDIDLGIPTALVTYHPATRDKIPVRKQVKALVDALVATTLPAVLTMANVDENGAYINAELRALCRKHPSRFKWVPNLGHLRYLSALRHFAVMIGNSSSGLIEAPSFRLPVINIGSRQNGRERAANVIDVPCEADQIVKAVRRAISPAFRAKIADMTNPYDLRGDGKASHRIKNVLRDTEITESLLSKRFWDFPYIQSLDSTQSVSGRKPRK